MEGHQGSGHEGSGGRGGRQPYYNNRGDGRRYDSRPPPKREVDPKHREIQEAPNCVFIHSSGKIHPPSLLKFIEDLV